MLFWIKKRLIYFRLQKSELGIDCLISGLLLQNDAGLSSLRHVRSEYKDKVPDVLDSFQNFERSCNSRLKLAKRKDLFVQCTEKLVKDEFM